MTNDLHLNHYQVLGIPPQSQPADIESAYQKLAQHFHPDHLPADTSPSLRQRAQTEFERIEAAYQTLSHTLRRKAYDMSLSLDSPPPPAVTPPRSAPLPRDIPPLDIPQTPPQQDWLFTLVLLVVGLMGLLLLLSIVPGLRRASPDPISAADPLAPIEAPPADPLVSPNLPPLPTDPLAANPQPPAALPADPLASTVVTRDQIQKWVDSVEELRPLYSRTASQLDQTQDPEERQRLQAEFEASASRVISENGLTPEEYRLISQLARENPQVQETIRALRP